MSILNIFSKILEIYVYGEVDSYLKEKHLIYNFQSRFKSGFSTDTCLIYFTCYIRPENDKRNVVGMVLLDVHKAFETVNHSILLTKLKACGMGYDICRCFESYLSDRQQLVDVSGTFSSNSTVT